MFIKRIRNFFAKVFSSKPKSTKSSSTEETPKCTKPELKSNMKGIKRKRYSDKPYRPGVPAMGIGILFENYHLAEMPFRKRKKVD